MLAASTIESYMIRVKLFLEWANTDTPTTNRFESYREALRKRISNWIFASLRANEVCDLDVEDINLQDLTVRVKRGMKRGLGFTSSPDLKVGVFVTLCAHNVIKSS